MKMKFITMRSLVGMFFPDRRVTNSLIAHASRMIREEGWLLNGWDMPWNRDRTLVIVRQDSPFAPILRFTHSQEADVPRGLIEACFDKLVDEHVGQLLGLHGLAITGANPCNLTLSPTSPHLAQMVNELRFIGESGLRPARTIVSTALDLPSTPKRLTRPARLRAADILGRLQIDALDLIKMKKLVRIKSYWRLSCLPSAQIPF